MLTTEINDLTNAICKAKTKEFQLALYKKTLSKRYLVLFDKQIDKLLLNLKSINILVNDNYIEDAYTIFRKFLETFFLISSVLKNPIIAETYMEHDSMVAKKALGNNWSEVKRYCENKPDGFLEYGYLESVINTNEENFKYTMHTVACSSGLNSYYRWYKITSNFVHNNLSQLKVNNDKLKENLKTMISTLINFINEFINTY